MTFLHKLSELFLFSGFISFRSQIFSTITDLLLLTSPRFKDPLCDVNFDKNEMEAFDWPVEINSLQTLCLPRLNKNDQFYLLKIIGSCRT